MSEQTEKRPVTEEERNNNRFSFVFGFFIVLAIMIIYIVLFNH